MVVEKAVKNLFLLQELFATALRQQQVLTVRDEGGREGRREVGKSNGGETKERGRGEGGR